MDLSKELDIKEESWDLIIQPKSSWFDLQLGEIWKYRDLLLLFVRRDFVSVYKQTILGPIWFFVQPVLTTIIFTIVFGKVAKIPTDGLPSIVFYMTGIVCWNYFADCLNKTSFTFTANAIIFGKVYFPRLIVPLSVILSNLIKFGVQFLLLLCFIGYYLSIEANVTPSIHVLLTPLLLIMMAGIGMGLGLIISSLTTKYRDFKFLIGFSVQLLMYGTPVIYPLSFLEEQYRWIVLLNPMTAIIETFKYAYLGAGSFNVNHLTYSFGFMIFVLFIGVLIFHKVEKTFMDTV